MPLTANPCTHVGPTGHQIDSFPTVPTKGGKGGEAGGPSPATPPLPALPPSLVPLLRNVGIEPDSDRPAPLLLATGRIEGGEGGARGHTTYKRPAILDAFPFLLEKQARLATFCEQINENVAGRDRLHWSSP